MFLSNSCRILPGWPPNSPDLNPIELILAILKQIPKRRENKGENGLLNAINTIWNGISQLSINSLVGEFYRDVL
jgi:transposase